MRKAPLDKSEAARGGAEASIPLVDRINSLHHEVQTHETQMLLKARAAGELLLEAKDTVLHGEWQDWLEANFEGSERTARRHINFFLCKG